MASSWVVLTILVAVVGAADPEKDKKMAAVNKVVSLLEGLTEKVKSEGKKEERTYNEFATFCKDNTKSRQASIQAGKDGVAKLTAAIKLSTSNKEKNEEDQANLVDAIDRKEKDMAKWTSHRKAEHKEYLVNAADLTNGIGGTDGAIKVMSANRKDTPLKKGAKFLQLSTAMKDTIEKLALMADALGLTSGNAVSSLLQDGPSGSLAETASSVQKIDPYAFQGDSILGALRKLQKDFKAQKADLDTEEKKNNDSYDKKMAAAEKFVKTKNAELEDKKKKHAQIVAQLAVEVSDKAGVSKQLADDKEYLTELVQICSDKKDTWDQRSKLRKSELDALDAATKIVKGTVAKKTSAATMRLIQQKFSATSAQLMVRNEDAMEAVEAEAEEEEDTPVGFLQRRLSSPHHSFDGVGMATRELEKELNHPERIETARQHDAVSASEASPTDRRKQAVMTLLRTQGEALKSSLLTSLASRIATDPFAKIKKLLQELIERQLQEAANENTQKGWCDKAIGDATQKRDYHAEALDDINAEMAMLEARRDKLTEELATLAEETADLKKAQADANKQRKEESAENGETIKEANAGLAAIQMAMDILDKFYKTSAKAEVDDVHHSQGVDAIKREVTKSQVRVDMPDAGFDEGEAYKGGQGNAVGVLGMMKVIESDFERTIRETDKAEARAQNDHLKFTTETQSSLAEKQVATTENTAANNETKKKLSAAKDNMKAKTSLLLGTIKELMQLQPTCVDTGMSQEDRVKARENEVDALKKALKLFEATEK